MEELKNGQNTNVEVEYGRSKMLKYDKQGNLPMQVENMLNLIKVGVSFNQSCYKVGLNPQTVKKWLKFGEKDENNDMDTIEYRFLVLYRMAKAECQEFLVKIIADAAKEKDWKAAAYLLERIYPQDFSSSAQNTPNENITIMCGGVKTTIENDVKQIDMGENTDDK